MKWKLNLPEYSTLVYYLGKLTGLAPFTIKNGQFHPPNFLSRFYPVFVATMYSLFTSIIFNPIMRDYDSNGVSSFSLTWGVFLYFMDIPGIFLPPIIFLFMYKKIVCLMNKLCIVSGELKNLGVKEDHGKYFKNLFVTTVIANTFLIAILALIIWTEPMWHFLFKIKYCIEAWFSFNTILIFVQMVIYIKQRFQFLNEKLYALMTPAGHRRSPHRAQIFDVSRNSFVEANQPGNDGLTDSQRIRKIRVLHLKFRDLVNRTTHLFAIPILLHSLRLGLEFMMSCYWIYLLLRKLSQSYNASLIVSVKFSILSLVIRNVFTIVSLHTIGYASSITCREGNATKDVLSKVSMASNQAELKNQFFIFTNQLMHTPVTMSALGLVNLDGSFIFKIFGTVVSSLIIMIQLEPSPV